MSGYAPTMELRWKIRPGPTQDSQPILQQLWRSCYTDEPPQWRDVLFQCAATDEYK